MKLGSSKIMIIEIFQNFKKKIFMIIKFGSKKHCVKKTLELKYSSPYEAWFFTNSDNRKYSNSN